MEYRVFAKRIDPQGSIATTKSAEIKLDTALAGRPDAFTPADLLIAALAACMIKDIKRVPPMLNFELQGVKQVLHAVQQARPPKIM